MTDKLITQKKGRIRIGSSISHDFACGRWPNHKRSKDCILSNEEIANTIFDCEWQGPAGNELWLCTAHGFGLKDNGMAASGNGSIFVRNYASIIDVPNEPYSKYFSVKSVEAFPRDCNESDRISEDTKIGDPGYQVKYSDSYVSWCPKEQFEKHNFRSDDLPFGLAFEALKSEHLISKRFWSEDTWLEPHFITAVTSDYGTYEQINTSLPTIMICTRNEDGVIFRQLWQPSLMSMFENDWYIYDEIYEEDNNK